MRPDVPSEELGFSVVEALVAVAIVAVITGAMYQVVATNARTAKAMSDRRLALLIAQSASDLVAVEGTGSNPRRGTMAGMSWAATGEPVRIGAWDVGIRTERIDVSVWKYGSAVPLVKIKTLVMRP